VGSNPAWCTIVKTRKPQAARSGAFLWAQFRILVIGGTRPVGARQRLPGPPDAGWLRCCTTLAGRRSRSTPREPVPIPDGRCLRVSDAVLLSGEDGGHCRVVQMIQGSFDQQVHTVGHTVDGQGYGAARAVHLVGEVGGERADRQQVLRGVGEQAVRSGTRSARP
jgi:hypothetical protein